MYYLILLPPTLTYSHVVARANTAYQCYEPHIPLTSLTFVDITIIICRIDMLFEVPLRILTIMLIVWCCISGDKCQEFSQSGFHRNM